MVNGVPAQGDIIKANLNPKKCYEQQGSCPYMLYIVEACENDQPIGLPETIFELAQFEENESVTVSVENGKIIIQKTVK